jgi:hypothetical protein
LKTRKLDIKEIKRANPKTLGDKFSLKGKLFQNILSKRLHSYVFTLPEATPNVFDFRGKIPRHSTFFSSTLEMHASPLWKTKKG